MSDPQGQFAKAIAYVGVGLGVAAWIVWLSYRDAEATQVMALMAILNVLLALYFRGDE